MTLTMLALWAILLVAPATPIGRFLKRHLIERPAVALPLVTRGHVALVLLLVLAGVAIVWLLDTEALRAAGFFAPDIVGVLTALEVSSYLDLAIAVVLAASTTRLRPALERLAGLARRPRPRAPRQHGARKPPQASNDDGDGPAWRAAA